MTQRDLTTSRDVSQQVVEKPSGFLEAAAEIGQKIIRDSQEAKINENSSKASLELNQLQSQYQTDFQSDPMGGLEAFKEQRKAIFDKYGEEISPLFRRDWTNKARDVGLRSDETIQAWGIKQSRVNTVSSINESMKNGFLQANIDGQNFGKTDDSEFDAFVNFQSSKDELSGWASKNLGEETSGQMLNGYDKDYMKSFVSGVAETNPKKAAQLLTDEKFKTMFTSDEINTFENVIKRNEKKQQIGNLYSQMDNEDKITDLVNSDGDYQSKRLEVDKMELSGEISPSVAVRARRVLTSQKNVDSKTDADTSADIITEIYDLNAMGDTNQEDYLIGVRNIREKIIDQQASGKITPAEAGKLNKQLRTLTAKKTADATQQVGVEFTAAKQKFDLLPPEYRGKATRELFFKTEGKENLPKDQYDAYATEIIDKYKNEFRATTVKKIDALRMPDQEFIKSKGYSMDDVRETAQKYGISEQEVIKTLKAK